MKEAIITYSKEKKENVALKRKKNSLEGSTLINEVRLRTNKTNLQSMVKLTLGDFAPCEQQHFHSFDFVAA